MEMEQRFNKTNSRRHTIRDIGTKKIENSLVNLISKNFFFYCQRFCISFSLHSPPEHTLDLFPIKNLYLFSMCRASVKLTFALSSRCVAFIFHEF